MYTYFKKSKNQPANQPQKNKKEEVYTSSYSRFVSIKDATLSHSWQE